MQARIWFSGNDMLVALREVRSSTMAAGTFLQSSTGITLHLWKSRSTSSTGNFVLSKNVPYAGSSGWYQTVVQSTDHSMPVGTVGMGRLVLRNSGLDGEWRPFFRVEYRYSS